MLQVFRIIKGIDKLDIGNFFELNSRPSRYNSLKLIKPRALTSHKQFSFSHRVINNWIELPDSVVLADNLRGIWNFFGRIKILNMKKKKKKDNTNKWVTLMCGQSWILDLHTHTESKIRNYVK